MSNVKRKAIKEWLRTGKRNAILTATAVVLAVSGAAVGLSATPFGNAGADIEPPGNYSLVDREAYSGVLLEKTADAGNNYLSNTLFLGDSNTLRMYMFQLLSLQNMIGIESIGIRGARNNECVYFEGQNDPVTMAEAVKRMKPQRIVVCLGTNDLPHVSVDDFIEEYKGFLGDLRSAYPYADVIISAIPPFAKKMEGTLKITKLKSFNVALVDLAREESGKFLDIGEALTGEDGYIRPEYAYSDGIHISEAAAQAWLKYVRTHAYETDDRRPAPLGTVAKQRYVPMWNPGSGTGDEALNTQQVLTIVEAELANQGFHKPKAGTDTSAWKVFTYTQAATLKADEEETLAKNIYLYFLGAVGALEGDVSVSCTESEDQWVFTLRYAAHTFPADETTWIITRHPTCQNEGTRTNTCLTCGRTVRQTLKKLEHDWDRDHGELIKEATCTQPGEMRYTCKNSGCIDPATNKPATLTEKTEALGHLPDTGVITTPSTCTTHGTRIYTCTRAGCDGGVNGAPYKEEKQDVPLSEHTWDAGTVTLPATSTAPGSVTFTCTVCGTTEVREIPMLPPPHTHKDEDIDGICDDCGEPYVAPSPVP